MASPMDWCEEPAAPAVAEDHLLARVEPTGGESRADCGDHAGDRHLADTPGGLDGVHAELGPEAGAGVHGRIEVEFHVTAQELLGRQVPEDEEGVGHGRLCPAPAVARRARHRAGRTGPDAQHAPGVGPTDRSPAGTDRLHVDQGQCGPHAHELAPGASDGLTTGDDGDVEGRPAHVARDHVRDPLGLGELGRGGHPGRWSRLGQADGYAAGLVHRDGAAGRMHEKEGNGQAMLRELRGQLLDTGKGARHVRVEEGEGGAFVFADRRVQRRSGDDRNSGEALVDRGEGVLLVHRVAERPQERQRECVGLLHLDQVLGCPYELFALERGDDESVAVDPLAHADDPVARDDLGRCRQPAVLVVDLTAAGEGHQFFETLCRNEPDAPSGP